MSHDAVILAGGRAARLGGADKAALVWDGRTFLERALAAVAGARAVVVVGPRPPVDLPAHARLTREDPPHTGPAAAVAAGLTALGPGADLVMLLACDMPHAADAVPALLDAARAAVSSGRDGAIAVDDDGRRQPLLSCLAAGRLRSALAAAGDPAGMPVRRLTAGLDLVDVVAERAAHDVDTPDDAHRLGVALPR